MCRHSPSKYSLDLSSSPRLPASGPSKLRNWMCRCSTLRMARRRSSLVATALSCSRRFSSVSRAGPPAAAPCDGLAFEGWFCCMAGAAAEATLPDCDDGGGGGGAVGPNGVGPPSRGGPPEPSSGWAADASAAGNGRSLHGETAAGAWARVKTAASGEGVFLFPRRQGRGEVAVCVDGPVAVVATAADGAEAPAASPCSGEGHLHTPPGCVAPAFREEE